MRITTAVALGACLFALSCPTVSAREGAPPSSDELARLIKGTWCTPDASGNGCEGYDTYVDDRNVQACGRQPGMDGVFRAASTYTIDGNRICYRVTRSNNARVMSAGDRFCADILRIDDRVQIYRFTDEAKAYTVRRVRGPAPCAGGGE